MPNELVTYIDAVNAGFDIADFETNEYITKLDFVSQYLTPMPEGLDAFETNEYITREYLVLPSASQDINFYTIFQSGEYDWNEFVFVFGGTIPWNGSPNMNSSIVRLIPGDNWFEIPLSVYDVRTSSNIKVGAGQYIRIYHKNQDEEWSYVRAVDVDYDEVYIQVW